MLVISHHINQFKCNITKKVKTTKTLPDHSQEKHLHCVRLKFKRVARCVHENAQACGKQSNKKIIYPIKFAFQKSSYKAFRRLYNQVISVLNDYMVFTLLMGRERERRGVCGSMCACVVADQTQKVSEARWGEKEGECPICGNSLYSPVANNKIIFSSKNITCGRCRPVMGLSVYLPN